MALRDVAAAHVARIDSLAAAYLGDRDSLGVMSRDELAAHVAAGDVVVLDVRPEPEFLSGHIPGAIHIAHDDLRARLETLPHEAKFVAYCRGPYCVMADDAERALVSSGRDAVRLDGGWPEWRVDGRPVAPRP